MAREDGPGTRQGTPPKGKTGTKAAGQNPLTNIPEFVSGGIDKMKDIGQDMFSDVAGDLGSKMRGKNLPGKGSNNFEAKEKAFFNTELENKDWRVKLSVPPSIAADGLLSPLQESTTGGHMVFPYTPTIIISHSAAYNTVSPIHNNYPFFAYQNSQVEAMTIVGQFYCQNSVEARYWMACLHYLRTMTKMDYGLNSTGSPPPIAKLNGYGDYVFNNVPVIIQNFNVTLPSDVDYIPAGVGFNGSYAPTRSEISVALMPQYSRDKVNKFSLDKFVNGGYILGGDGYL
jgi:hypothetical protein